MAKSDKKIEGVKRFLQLYPKSEYRDDALFELANTMLPRIKITCLKNVWPIEYGVQKRLFHFRSILRQGLIYYNTDKDDQALLKFKKVAADFPRTPEAR